MRKYPGHSAMKKKKKKLDELTFEVIHWHFNNDERERETQWPWFAIVIASGILFRNA